MPRPVTAPPSVIVRSCGHHQRDQAVRQGGVDEVLVGAHALHVARCWSTGSIAITPVRPETSRPGARSPVRGRNRFEVRLASRTGAPGRDRGVRLPSGDAPPPRARPNPRHPSRPQTYRPPRSLVTTGWLPVSPDIGTPTATYWSRFRHDVGRQRTQEVSEATTVPSGAARCTGTPPPAKSRTTERSPSARAELGQHHHRLEPLRPAGHRHRDRDADRGQPQRRQVDRSRRRRCGRRVADARRPRRPGAGPGRPGERDELGVLGAARSAGRASGSASSPAARAGRLDRRDQHGADPVAAPGRRPRPRSAGRAPRPARRGSAPGRGAWPSARRRCRRRRPRGRPRTARRARRPGSRAMTRTAPSASSSTAVALDVVLVGDLADDLLEDVLDRDQAGGAAVLVDDDRDVRAARPASRAAARRPAWCRGRRRRAHHRLDLLGRTRPSWWS